MEVGKEGDYIPIYHRNDKDYLGRGEGVEGGMEVGEEGECIPMATLSPPE